MTDGRFGEGSWRKMPESLMCGSLCLEIPCSIARSLGPACFACEMRVSMLSNPLVSRT